MISATPKACDVRGCAEAATGRYLDTARDTAVEFRVCATHFARISGGERPVVTQQADRPDARPELLLQ